MAEKPGVGVAGGTAVCGTGDSVTLPTTAREALDLLSGYVDVVSSDDDDERPDLAKAFELLDQFVRDYSEETDCTVCGESIDVHGWHDDLSHRYS
jgi:hypothetical protein